MTSGRGLACFGSIALAVLLLIAGAAQAEVAGETAMNQVCGNWLTAMVSQQGSWAGSVTPGIRSSQVLTAGDTALGIVYSIDPTGFVLVPYLTALPAVMAYSDESDLDVQDTIGMVQMLRDILLARDRTFIARYGSLNAVTAQKSASRQPSSWDVYALDDQSFAVQLAGMQPMTGGDILLGSNAWSQGYPWNLKCPPDGGCTRTWVGCVATGASQIMRYWQWPSKGLGSHCYNWHGQSNSAQLCAAFNHTYDWANMPLRGSGSWTPAEQEALSGLSYDLGVAYNMMYGCDGSGAYIETNVWSTYFWYDAGTHLEYRNNYSAQGWFELIQSECEARRPMQMAIYPLAHAPVLDGWRIFSGNQMHVNYGWGGSTTGWFFIDSLYGSDPTYEYMRVGIKPSADSFHVYLTVNSANPDTGVAISVSPADTNGQSNGSTPFMRNYSPDKSIALVTPSSAGGNSFAKWQRDGIDYPGGPSVLVTTDMNHTMTAVYLPCSQTVQLPWTSPRSPVCANSMYLVAWRPLAGASGYEIRENGGGWTSNGTDTTRSFMQSVSGTYTYEVRPLSGCGTGATSTPISITVESNAPATPLQPVPTPLTAVCPNSQYSLSWAPVAGADDYQIREDGGVWQNLGLITVWMGMKAVSGTWTYEVRAINACGASNASPPVSITVSGSGAGPDTPGQLTFQPGSPICVNRQCAVRWNPVPNAEYYEIRENGGAWHNCGAANMWGVIKTTPGTWTYELRAGNGCGTSAVGPPASVTMGKCFDIVVFSMDPPEGVTITLSLVDQDGFGSGPTPFSRNYYQGASVTLQAPASASGSFFNRWQRDGVDFSTQPSITVSIDTSRYFTALYSPCSCPWQGDLNSDAAIDVFDVIAAIGVAFSGDSDPQDAGCVRTRGDVDDNGVTDVFDVIFLIATAFSGGGNPVSPCSP
ncbi:MAG: C10 family peptidase [candidate division Zixibacteria bacterium]|nr:C10 family peptidase [candidate division Zixibacteria bacterium]